MLKKAGIVVAVAATALFVGSPVAFAEGSPVESRGHGIEQATPEQQEPPGSVIDLDDLDLLSNLNVCPDLNVGAAVGDILGILSPGNATTNIADAPITCTSSDHNG